MHRSLSDVRLTPGRGCARGPEMLCKSWECYAKGNGCAQMRLKHVFLRAIVRQRVQEHVISGEDGGSTI